jgi:hypothetical protein
VDVMSTSLLQTRFPNTVLKTNRVLLGIVIWALRGS